MGLERSNLTNLQIVIWLLYKPQQVLQTRQAHPPRPGGWFNECGANEFDTTTFYKIAMLWGDKTKIEEL